MASTGVNLAITKDGGTYNKLQRPQDYLMSTTNPPPRQSVPRASAPSRTNAGKRKHDAADSTFKHKRARPEEEDLGADDFSGWAASNKRTRRTKNGILVELPGLEGDVSSDDGIGEALAYLREVRSEASAIPSLLVASTSRSHDQTDSSHQVLFTDGTWIAVDPERANQSSEARNEELNILDPQNRLYELLLRRFHHLRATLIAPLEQSTTFTTRVPSALGNEYPKTKQVICLKDVAVYAALKKSAEGMDQAASISHQSSCWMWTLLALAGDVGTLDNDRISRIRELGQKAGLLGERLRETRSKRHFTDGDSRTAGLAGECSVDSDAMSMSSEGEVMPNSEDVTDLEQARARARLLTQLGDRLVQPELPALQSPSYTADRQSESGKLENGDDQQRSGGEHGREGEDVAGCGIDLNTRATIDMVLTIVAEYFGQRDLLKYRQPW